MAILLKKATYINWRTLEFRYGDLLVDRDEIRFGENGSEIHAGQDDVVIDCSGKLVTKSFAVGHHHVYSALARGMGAPKKNPENFQEVLKYVWWTLDKCLDEEMIESSALVTAIACAKAGATFVIDHHASPFAVNGSLEIISSAFEKVGISHLLCYEISDRDGAEIAQKGLDETEAFLNNHQGLVGLHASFTVSDETMKKASALIRRLNSGAHIHVAEDHSDQDITLRTYGKRVVKRLYDHGLLTSSKTILAHCIHLEDNERDLLENSPVWIVQNAESNMNNNVGRFCSKNLGSNIMLGTDGINSDMIQSTRAAFLSGQGFDNIDYQIAYQRLRNAHHYLHNNSFTGDGESNLIVLDYDSPTAVNSTNFFGHFIFGFSSAHVQHVISEGELIIKDRQALKVDENEILERSKICASRLWKKMKDVV